MVSRIETKVGIRDKRSWETLAALSGAQLIAKFPLLVRQGQFQPSFEKSDSHRSLAMAHLAHGVATDND